MKPEELQTFFCPEVIEALSADLVIGIPRILTVTAGGIQPAAMLARLLPSSVESVARGTDGWVHIDLAEWQQAGLIQADVESARKKLLFRKLIEMRPIGDPPLLFMRVQFEEVSILLQRQVRKAATRDIDGDLPVSHVREQARAREWKES